MFSKVKTIIYIRRNNLIIAGKTITPAKLIYPTDVLYNLELIDPQAFLSAATTFFAKQDLKGKKIVIVLDESTVFSKHIDVENMDKKSIQNVVAAFVDAIPFKTGQRACLDLVDKKQLDIYATNAQIYETVIEALHDAGADKIISVNPTDAFRLEASTQPAAAIEKYMNDSYTQHNADFLAVAAV